MGPVGRVSFSVLFKSEIFGVGFKILLGKVFIAETGQKRARSLVMTDRERKTAALYLGQQTVGFECFVNARPRVYAVIAVLYEPIEKSDVQ